MPSEKTTRKVRPTTPRLSLIPMVTPHSGHPEPYNTLFINRDKPEEHNGCGHDAQHGKEHSAYQLTAACSVQCTSLKDFRIVQMFLMVMMVMAIKASIDIVVHIDSLLWSCKDSTLIGKKLNFWLYFCVRGGVKSYLLLYYWHTHRDARGSRAVYLYPELPQPALLHLN